MFLDILVRQGEMCVLFSLYLNDLEDFFQINDINGLKSISDEVETELNYYLKLFVIVYADDSVLNTRVYIAVHIYNSLIHISVDCMF
jgi:hypothetical protein